MRALQRREGQRHVAIGVVLAGMIDAAVAPTAEDHLERFHVHRLRFGRIDAEGGDLPGQHAAADADLQTPARQIIEHAQLLDQPQRIVERQAEHHRAEPEAPRALRGGGEEHGWLGCEAERRRVVLGEVPEMEAGGVVALDQPQAVLVDIGDGDARPPVEMTEDAEGKHAPSP